ncbi:MAG: flagellar hook protein FlgE [Gallionellales bacterium 35-53-114]|jgi:flagellar hook protein FlgE|nr:MAG: flagellar hook protein FlgE [Gallionellales bacterium 35-53-114]OYZ64229.1 MAG: flagellar hook protein FlgE [Gallionellales bacterium 24-53-125]OZB10461.1 MAG: flagellar hook protein FlgE [Gallionellales bacterium 39-52-133]HQS57079.1 flagellar hook protein FlgE [Gallionellaceae bacterium]HQS74733.1 flagellar hook protein FlgE [Gallionellaceae bacterium]
MGFQQGLSGLNVAAKNLDVIGNNVSNANTVGFKQSQAQFADVYTAAQGGTTTPAIGIGTKVATVAQQFGQGNVSITSNPLDLAVSGRGFFQIDDNGATKYSRNGQFQLNKDGFIVNSQGHKLTGYQANPATGEVSTGSTGALQLSTKAITPSATGKSEIGLNLDSRETAPRVSVFNPTDPESYNRSTAMTIFDTLGNEHVLNMYFQKAPTPVNTWNTYVTVDNQPANPGTAAAGGAEGAEGAAPAEGAAAPVPGVPTGTLVGTLTFNSTGGLAATNPATTPLGIMSIPGGIVFANGSSTPQEMTMDFNMSTQFGAPFGVTALNQNGYTSGQLNGFSTSADGTILGRYTNGQSKALGQVVLANFANEQGLQPLGNNEWGLSAASGQPLVGQPGTASLGVLQSGAVEDSNVDLTAELVNMIMAQRVYQANAQTIKAQDSILQTITNIR